jgi:mRNA interferase MazF
MLARRGDIWWVDFGTPIGSVQGGQRPALILQNDTGNANSSTTIVAAITSKKKRPYPFHVDISRQESGLTLDSVVMLEQIQTIPEIRLIRSEGKLSIAKMKEIDTALHFSLRLI